MTNDLTNYLLNSNSRSLSKLRIYVLNVVDELNDIGVVEAHKQEEISRCGESRSSCVKILLKGIVATYDTVWFTDAV